MGTLLAVTGLQGWLKRGDRARSKVVCFHSDLERGKGVSDHIFHVVQITGVGTDNCLRGSSKSTFPVTSFAIANWPQILDAINFVTAALLRTGRRAHPRDDNY
jgi:hypothetical protein